MKSLKQYWKGREASYFVLHKIRCKAFLGLRFVLQSETSECVQGALDWKGDYMLEWVTQGECAEVAGIG